jgi:beta-lactam-binding protein with PASTA domain
MIFRAIKWLALPLVIAAAAGISAYLTLTFLIKSEDTVVVPDLVGKDVVFALKVLSDLSLNTKVRQFAYHLQIPADHVIYQEPEAGADLKKGRDVRIILSKGAQTILVPNLTGLPMPQARVILDENDLCQGVLSMVHVAHVENDHVISQVPRPSTIIQRGACVDLLVSAGTRPLAYAMPDITAISLNQAILLIEQCNLSLNKIQMTFDESKPDNVVLDQEPLSGHRVMAGQAVNMLINRRSAQKSAPAIFTPKGIGLFRYQLNQGFLKKHIVVRMNGFGISIDLLDDFVQPGEDIWLLIPQNHDITVRLYEDDLLVRTKVYE